MYFLRNRKLHVLLKYNFIIINLILMYRIAYLLTVRFNRKLHKLTPLLLNYCLLFQTIEKCIL